MRNARRAAAGAAVLFVALAASVLWVAQSGWFREKVRLGIVKQAEKASGGRVEIGHFDFDWHTLTVRLDRFVVHGTEPSGAMPLLAIDRVTVGLRILSLLRRDVAVESIVAEHPEAHVIVQSDGGTNVPRPRLDRKESLSGQILDLKVGRFDLERGGFQIDTPNRAARIFPLEARGENLKTRVNFDPVRWRYAGSLSVDTVRYLGTDFQVGAEAALERNRVIVSRASVRTGSSHVEFANAVLTNFSSPVITADYDARLSLAELRGLADAKFTAAGELELSGHARFASPGDYSLAGSLRGAGLSAGQFRNIGVTGRLEAAPGGMRLSGMQLNLMGGQINGSVETADMKTFRAEGRLAHFDLREAAKLRISRPLPWDGLVSGTFEASGTWKGFGFNTHLLLSPASGGAPVRGDVSLRYAAAESRIDLGDSWLELPHTRAEFSGTPGGQLRVRVHSTDFADLRPIAEIVKGSAVPAVTYSSLDFDGAVAGSGNNLRVLGHGAVREAVYLAQRIQSFTGDIAASPTSVSVSHAEVVFPGVHARGSAAVQLSGWSAGPTSPITANVEISNSEIAKMLEAAGHREVEIAGALSASARITGTLAGPLADADVTLSKGSIYEQPFDSITGRLQVVSRTSQALTGLFISGPKRINITARFEHAGTQFPAGTLGFNLTSNTMPLNQIALVRRRQPDIHGFGKFHAEGSLTVSHDARHQIQFNLSGLNADASANGLELGGRNLGDARFTAHTRNDVLTAVFDSNAAQASIHGEGAVSLSGDYPASGKVTLNNASLNALAALAVKSEDAKSLNFDGSAEGELTFNGPLKKPAQMTAAADIPRLEIRPLPGTALAQSLPNFVLTNSGPIRAAISGSSVRLESVHLKAPQTDLTVTGTAALSSSVPLNLRVQGTLNLALARTFNADLAASGSLALNAAIRGNWQTPDVSGRADLRNGDFHYADFSNGLTEAAGEITFSGTHATIQSFTAQSGGGKVDATGFVALTNGTMSFRVETTAHEVRVRYPEGVSSVSDASLTFAGTSARSETSGTITVHRVTVNPKSDAASILASTASPIQTAAAKDSFASNMNLDVQIATAPNVALQTSLTESLQADASLRLRGTLTNPALIGRINITQGEMTFFGNKYSINAGSISFFNPARIDPILNIDLETKARGVDVVLTVSGPVNKLNVSYRSDPPLQFSDIVALLATGRAPTDPTIAVRDTGQAQGFQQLGASALIGQAIANPVAGRLQRFFGVSRLKIDPSLTGITGSPEARLTIEQQVTPEILFTYITDVSSTSTQLIRVEWSFNRHWSAILIREENGYVGLDFAYKKRFK